MKKNKSTIAQGYRVRGPKLHNMAQPNRSIKRLGDATLTFTLEGEERDGEIKQQPRQNERLDALRKHANARSTKRSVPTLTCTEDQVDRLLSEGEST